MVSLQELLAHSVLGQVFSSLLAVSQNQTLVNLTQTCQGFEQANPSTIPTGFESTAGTCTEVQVPATTSFAGDTCNNQTNICWPSLICNKDTLACI